MNRLLTQVRAELQLVARNGFLANLAVFRTGDQMLGALLDVRLPEEVAQRSITGASASVATGG